MQNVRKNVLLIEFLIVILVYSFPGTLYIIKNYFLWLMEKNRKRDFPSVLISQKRKNKKTKANSNFFNIFCLYINICVVFFSFPVQCVI